MQDFSVEAGVLLFACLTSFPGYANLHDRMGVQLLLLKPASWAGSQKAQPELADIIRDWEMLFRGTKELVI